MFAEFRLVRMICDRCRRAESPLAPNVAEAKKTAKALGWKIHRGSCGVPRRHVCPACFAKLLAKVGDDRAARARLACNGVSGETCTDLAKLWGVVTWTVILWARRGYAGEKYLRGRPRTGQTLKSRRRAQE